MVPRITRFYCCLPDWIRNTPEPWFAGSPPAPALPADTYWFMDLTAWVGYPHTLPHLDWQVHYAFRSTDLPFARPTRWCGSLLGHIPRSVHLRRSTPRNCCLLSAPGCSRLAIQPCAGSHSGCPYCWTRLTMWIPAGTTRMVHGDAFAVPAGLALATTQHEQRNTLYCCGSIRLPADRRWTTAWTDSRRLYGFGLPVQFS